MPDLKVKADQITTTDKNATVIANPTLADFVKSQPEKTAKQLSEWISPIEASTLSVDSFGRVTVQNEEFTRKISEAAKLHALDGFNIICPPNAVIC